MYLVKIFGKLYCKFYVEAVFRVLRLSMMLRAENPNKHILYRPFILPVYT